MEKKIVLRVANVPRDTKKNSPQDIEKRVRIQRM